MWELVSDSRTQPELLGGRNVLLLSELMRDRTEFIGTPTELSVQIDPVGSEGITPKKVARLILQSVAALSKSVFPPWCAAATESGLSSCAVPKVTMHRVPKLLTLSTLPMSQAVKTPRVSACEPLCARLGAGVACVPAEGIFCPHRANSGTA